MGPIEAIRSTEISEKKHEASFGSKRQQAVASAGKCTHTRDFNKDKDQNQDESTRGKP